MTSITPFLWFDHDAEEAAKFYTSIFPDSHIDPGSSGAGDNPSMREGEVMTVDFTLGGRQFIALNGGPDFHFTEAISIGSTARIRPRSTTTGTPDSERRRAEHVRLAQGPVRYVVAGRPEATDGDVSTSPDRDGARRAMEAMLKMQRLDVAKLKPRSREPGRRSLTLSHSGRLLPRGAGPRLSALAVSPVDRHGADPSGHAAMQTLLPARSARIQWPCSRDSCTTRPPAAMAASARAAACSRARDTSRCIACRSGFSASSSCIQTVELWPKRVDAVVVAHRVVAENRSPEAEVDLVRLR